MSSIIPEHIAVIMDGNGRWAKQRGLPRVSGHQAGAESVDEIVTGCRELGVRYLTLYSFSKENWRRPRGEISFLMELLSSYLKDRLEKMLKNNIRFNCIGDLRDLPNSVEALIRETKEKTAHNDALTLTLALSYGGRQEITAAAKALCRDVQEGKVKLEDIKPEQFARYLYTTGIPDPDLVIRTSGEYRLSNFLLWQSSYAELYVSRKLWPDFRRMDLEEAIREFGTRERRFGRTGIKEVLVKRATKEFV